MATFQVVLRQSLAGETVETSWHYNNITMPAGVGTAPNELAVAFEGSVMAELNALQSDEVTNIEIYCRDLGNPGTAVTNAVTGAGDIATTDLLTMPPDLPLHVSMSNGAWVDVVTATAYVGVRPGGKGGKYLPGLTEDWSSVTGAAVPAALATAWTDFVAAVLGTPTLPTGGYVMTPVIFSSAKSALSGLPARNPLVAPVTGLSVGRFTRLLSRRP